MDNIRILKRSDTFLLQELFESCSDYFLNFENREIRKDEANLFWDEVPENISLKNKKNIWFI